MTEIQGTPLRGIRFVESEWFIVPAIRSLLASIGNEKVHPFGVDFHIEHILHSAEATRLVHLRVYTRLSASHVTLPHRFGNIIK
jgi:hypothetical protein